MFGEGVSYAGSQEGTGAESSVRVFHVHDEVVVTYHKADAQSDEKPLHPDLLFRLESSGAQIRSSPPNFMIRGGDTIVWMKVRFHGPPWTAQ
jgi:hypothetical protein